MAKSKRTPPKNTKSFFLSTKLILIILAGFAVLSISAAAYFRLLYVSETNRINTYDQTTWQQGEIIIDDRFAFSFNGIRTDESEIPGIWELEENNHFVIVNVSFKNTSEQTYQMSPITTMQIKDESGRYYTVSSATALRNSIGGPVEPGQTIVGEVGFTMPKAVKNGTFLFTPNIEGTKQISIPFAL